MNANFSFCRYRYSSSTSKWESLVSHLLLLHIMVNFWCVTNNHKPVAYNNKHLFLIVCWLAGPAPSGWRLLRWQGHFCFTYFILGSSGWDFTTQSHFLCDDWYTKRQALAQAQLQPQLTWHPPTLQFPRQVICPSSKWRKEWIFAKQETDVPHQNHK